MAATVRTTNPSRLRLEQEVRRFARETKRGMLVLDAGAGRSPYRELFAHASYEAADFARVHDRYAPLDYVCELTDIPVEDERFDRILFSQVLEHLPDPAAAIAELYRVLKPGGRILCSAPLFYEEHQGPYDFYRYTRWSLRRLFRQAGFRVTRLSWLEGYFATVSYQFGLMNTALPGPDSVRLAGLGWRTIYIAPIIAMTRVLAGWLQRFYAGVDARWKYTDKGMPKNYVLLAKKRHKRRPDREQ
jgi:SAM-dependent methyltransferase